MANKVYIQEETKLTWSETGTGAELKLDLGSSAGAANGVAQGERADRGAAPRAAWYRWTLAIDGWDTQPVVGEYVEVYIAQGDGTHKQGNLSTGTGAPATGVLSNLTHLGGCAVQSATTANQPQAVGDVFLTARYVQPVIHNDTADKLKSTGDSHRFTLTPIPDEIQ